MKENYVFMRGGAYARVKGRKALVVVFFQKKNHVWGY
jgi:hypothetical protein